jgi:hypothetical protein
LIQGVNKEARSRRRGLSHRKVCIDQVKAVITRSHAVALQLFRTKSPDHPIAEAAAPERQKRTPSLIATNAVTIFYRQSASRAVHGGIDRLQNRS